MVISESPDVQDIRAVFNNSAAEDLQQLLPYSRVVKVFTSGSIRNDPGLMKRTNQRTHSLLETIVKR